MTDGLVVDGAVVVIVAVLVAVFVVVITCVPVAVAVGVGVNTFPGMTTFAVSEPSISRFTMAKYRCESFPEIADASASTR